MPKKNVAVVIENNPRLAELQADNQKWENFFKIQNERREWQEWVTKLGDDSWE